MTFDLHLPSGSDGLMYGVGIHRHVAPEFWKDALAEVPAIHRQGAETYLATIVAREIAREHAKAAKR